MRPSDVTPLFQQAFDTFDKLRALVPDNDRLNADEHAVLVALTHALRVDCRHALVGAVAVDQHGRFIGAGRNGSPPNRPGCREGACTTGVHAIENLAYFTPVNQRRDALVALTEKPCAGCERIALSVGLGRTVFPVKVATDVWDVEDADGNQVPTTPLFQQAMYALTSLLLLVPTSARLTKDEHAILVAMAHSLRADCTRRRVGAVGTDPHGRFIGAGRNGAPPRRPGCLSSGACPRGQLSYNAVAAGSSYTAGAGACSALHAEENLSLFTSPDDRRGGTAAVTDAPCDNCSKVLAGAGWKRAIWPERAADLSVSIRVLDVQSGPIGGLYAA